MIEELQEAQDVQPTNAVADIQDVATPPATSEAGQPVTDTTPAKPASPGVNKASQPIAADSAGAPAPQSPAEPKTPSPLPSSQEPATAPTPVAASASASAHVPPPVPSTPAAPQAPPPLPSLVPPAPTVIVKEVIREIPVEKIVEKPVEVIKEMPVERIVERIVEKEVVREVKVFDAAKAKEEWSKRAGTAHAASLATRWRKRDDRLAKILTLAKEKGGVTNDDAQIAAAISDRTATYYLKLLVKQGKLKPLHTRGRYARYAPV